MDDLVVPKIPRPDPVPLTAPTVDGDGDQSMTNGDKQPTANPSHPPSLAFLSPEELAPPVMPTKAEMENFLLEIRKRALLEEYLGKES